MRYASTYGFYELNPFPGCNQIVVSNHSFIPEELRGQGLGQAQHLDRINHMRKLGYDYAICTVKSDNEPQIHILKKAGWKHFDSFMNKETGNFVEIWGKLIT